MIGVLIEFEVKQGCEETFLKNLEPNNRNYLQKLR